MAPADPAGEGYAATAIHETHGSALPPAKIGLAVDFCQQATALIGAQYCRQTLQLNKPGLAPATGGNQLVVQRMGKNVLLQKTCRRMAKQFGVVKQLTLTVVQLLDLLSVLGGYTQKTDPIVVPLRANR